MKIKIVRECSEFLKASNGQPLVKMLPKGGPTVRSVKVRKRKSITSFDEAFNTVFSEHENIRQRCVFTNGVHSQSADPKLAPFYIFPKNGFRFMYSTEVTDSSQQYGSVFNHLKETMDEDNAIATISDVLLYDYKMTELAYGIRTGCEVIIFGCQSYYAIQKNSVKSYSTLFLSLIHI